MAKDFKENRDRKRDRAGWREQRNAARIRKNADRGAYIGKRRARRAGKLD